MKRVWVKRIFELFYSIPKSSTEKTEILTTELAFSRQNDLVYIVACFVCIYAF